MMVNCWRTWNNCIQYQVVKTYGHQNHCSFQAAASLDHSSVDASRSVGFKVEWMLPRRPLNFFGSFCRFVSTGDEPVLRRARAEPLDIWFDSAWPLSIYSLYTYTYMPIYSVYLVSISKNQCIYIYLFLDLQIHNFNTARYFHENLHETSLPKKTLKGVQESSNLFGLLELKKISSGPETAGADFPRVNFWAASWQIDSGFKNGTRKSSHKIHLVHHTI